MLVILMTLTMVADVNDKDGYDDDICNGYIDIL